MLESFPPGFILKAIPKNILESKYSRAAFGKRKVPTLSFYDADYRKKKDKKQQRIPIKNVQGKSLRVKTIDFSGKIISESYLVEKTLKDQPKKVRVKAIAKPNNYGITESEWVLYDAKKHEKEIQALNQYRVKSVATNGLDSKWIYSALVTDTNEEIISQMISDYLDIALSMKDDKLDFSLDFALVDFITKEFLDYLPEYRTETIFNENRTINYSELSSLVGSSKLNPKEERLIELIEVAKMFSQQMPKFIEESKALHYEEIREVYRSYVLSDSEYFNIKEADMKMLFTQILEDALKIFVDETNKEVMLYKNEGLEVIMQSIFDFKSKGDVVDALILNTLDDTIISLGKDILKLIVEPSFMEWYETSIKEDSILYVNKVLASIWTLVCTTDAIEKLFINELIDYKEFEIVEDIVEYYLHEDGIITNRSDMPKDIMKLFLIDQLKSEVQPEFEDNMIHLILNKGFKLLVNYAPEEALTMVLSASNEMLQKPSPIIIEDFSTNISSSFKNEMKMMKRNLESYVVDFVFDAVVKYKQLKNRFIEDVQMALSDKTKHSLNEKELLKDEMDLIFEMYFKEILTTFSHHKEEIHMNIEEYIKHAIQYVEKRIESLVINSSDIVDKTWLINPKDLIEQVQKDTRAIQLAIYRFENIPHKFEDSVQYGVGNFDSDYPIGTFKIGFNGLGGKSEVIKQ